MRSRREAVVDRKISSPPQGFTLVELLVVLALVALLAGTAALLVRYPVQQAKNAAAVESLIDLNRICRARAWRGEGVQLRIEPRRNRIEARQSNDSRPIQLVQWEKGVQIVETFRFPHGPHATPLTIDYGLHGDCATFGVCLQKPKGAKEWIIFFGLSGDYQRYSDEHGREVIESLLSATPRADAR